MVAAPAVTEAAVEVQAGAGGRVDGQARPSTAPASNSRRAPGGASTLVLG